MWQLHRFLPSLELWYRWVQLADLLNASYAQKWVCPTSSRPDDGQDGESEFRFPQIWLGSPKSSYVTAEERPRPATTAAATLYGRRNSVTLSRFSREGAIRASDSSANATDGAPGPSNCRGFDSLMRLIVTIRSIPVNRKFWFRFLRTRGDVSHPAEDRGGTRETHTN